MSEGVDGGDTVLEVEHLSVAVICGVHLFQAGVSVQHGLPCLDAVILDQFASNANPLAALESAKLGFRVGVQLLGNILLLAGLDVQLALKNVRRTKGANSRLVAFHGCQIVGLGFFQELVGAGPSILPAARPFGRLKSPLGTSLLRKRELFDFFHCSTLLFA